MTFTTCFEAAVGTTLGIVTGLGLGGLVATVAVLLVMGMERWKG